jgi:hypothetical protein
MDGWMGGCANEWMKGGWRFECEYIDYILYNANELYRPSDSRLSVKLVATFGDRGSRVVSAAETYGRNLGFLDRSRFYFF